jgi:Protein of unknown function (DUF3108)
MVKHKIICAIVGLLLAGTALAGPPQAATVEVGPVLHYAAEWAGLPAAQIDVALGGVGTHYRDEIDIHTEGLPRWFTNFNGEASSEGELAADGGALPQRYDALYTLRRRKGKRAALRVVEQDGARLTIRAPEDTSTKPLLDEKYRRDVLDPISALAAIRHHLETHPHTIGGEFTIPVFDGARRFDVIGRIVPAEADPADGPVVQLVLSLRPIAGFKGETSEDGDPDSAPRDVDLRVTDDARLLPLYMRVHIAFLPLVVRYERSCAKVEACQDPE